jgi:dipeptidyl aminopeptidase/acylaminoacyl peptidase
MSCTVYLCRDVFKAGASLYGVADIELLAKHTHKFESRYMDLLVGPYPEAIDVYKERSPIHSADKITVPVAILQVRVGCQGVGGVLSGGNV